MVSKLVLREKCQDWDIYNISYYLYCARAKYQIGKCQTMTLIPKGQLIVITQKLDNENPLKFWLSLCVIRQEYTFTLWPEKKFSIFLIKKPFAKAFSNASIDFFGMIKIYSLDISFLNDISYLVLLY